MDKREIISKIDHTELSPSATWEDIRTLCDDALCFGAASVCIPPAFVKRASEYLCGRLAVCTVIGFPNGYSTTKTKCFEAAEAVENGADEIDMVINIGKLKEKRYDELLDEINAVKSACGEKLLKVIIETCLLTDEEKIRMCEIVSESHADYIKTSTGFSSGGATREDIALFAEHVREGTLIKAAGGIKDLSDAEEFIRLGASRLGTSRIIKSLKTGGEGNGNGTY